MKAEFTWAIPPADQKGRPMFNFTTRELEQLDALLGSDRAERLHRHLASSPALALDAESRTFAAEVLRREGNRRIARIEPTDDESLRSTLIGAAQRCDDVAAAIERAPMPDPDAERREVLEHAASGFFVALVAVARQYVEALGALDDRSVASAIDLAMIGLHENLVDLFGIDE